MNKVFLGGTCNESTWREDLIELLKIDYFNPVVEDWTEECMAEERKQRETCDFVLYTITPKMTGVYSIAEVIDDSNKRPEKTIFCLQLLDSGRSFTNGQEKSLIEVGKMVERNGGKFFLFLENVADYLNEFSKNERPCVVCNEVKKINTDGVWIDVLERLPEKPTYDWVLVKCQMVPEGHFGVPHIAELRNGVWYSDGIDTPLEETCGVKVTHWMPLPGDTNKKESYNTKAEYMS